MLWKNFDQCSGRILINALEEFWSLLWKNSDQCSRRIMINALEQLWSMLWKNYDQCSGRILINALEEFAENFQSLISEPSLIFVQINKLQWKKFQNTLFIKQKYKTLNFLFFEFHTNLFTINSEPIKESFYRPQTQIFWSFDLI